MFANFLSTNSTASEADDELPTELGALNKLRSIDTPFSGGPVIAVDLDDVLCQTNVAVSFVC